MIKSKLNVLILLATLLFSSSLQAMYDDSQYYSENEQGSGEYYDGDEDEGSSSSVKREGFYISLGGGYQITNSEYTNGDTHSANGLATSFHIGYGFTNDIIVYYSSDVSWYDSDSADPETQVAGLGGIGITYYLSEYMNDDTLYMKASYGLTSTYMLSDASAWSMTGTGFLLGVGYNLTDSWSVEADYISMAFDTVTTSFGTYDLSSDSLKSSMRVLLRYSWY